MKKKAFVFTTCLIVIVCLVSAVTAFGAFLQKKFVVVKDQGRDVLCDSYIVKKDDYVTKLFKQRGEISLQDFPLFLKIFQRINPEVKDIDLIYPNQRILVPLKIIEPDTLEGQETGTVTIPLITITNIPEQLQQNSMDYVVQEGDSVSQLIAGKFGRFSTRPYKEAVEIFKFLNPQIEDINLIHVGQTINLPVPTVRDEAWYPQLFDESGQLVVREADLEEPEPEEEVAEAEPVKEETTLEAIEPIKTEIEVIEPIAEEAVEAEAEIEPEKAKKEVQPEITPLPSIFKRAAQIYQADLLDQGEYFFPRKKGEDLVIDLSKTPVMEFQSGLRILFAKTTSLAEEDYKIVVSYWKNLRIVTMSYDAPLRELLYTICTTISKDSCENNLALNDNGVKVNITAEYLYDNPDRTGKRSITIIPDHRKRTSDPIRQYLQGKQVTISEWIDNEKFSGPVPPPSPDASSKGKAKKLNTMQVKGFVKEFVNIIGLRYQEKVEVSFPYAGFQVKAYTNLLSVAPGKDVLIDFGDLQGDAIQAIEATGFEVIQIDKRLDYKSVMDLVLSLVGAYQTENPVFWTANRDREYNISIQIPGRLVSIRKDRERVKMVITGVALEKGILSFLNQAGIQVLQIAGY
jgi:hypothetical protein